MSGTSSVFVFWGALAAVATAFGAFAYLFASALREGTAAYSRQMGAETSRQFEDVFLFIPAAKIAELGRLAAAAAFFLFFIPLFSITNAWSTVIGIVMGILAALFLFTLPKRVVGFLRIRRRRRLEEQLVDALGTMANALRAGFSLSQAFESVIESGVNPIRQEFQVFQQQLRIGMAFDEALTSLDTRVGSEDFTLMCTAIDIARKTGGNLVEIFERISETIRGRLRIERRIRTLTAQGRLQGLVVSLMPIALGGILTVMKPALMLPFFQSVSGGLCVAVMIVLEVIGWLIIRKIIRIEV